ncbi:MAG: hypothetical protein H6621_11390 [Halobacteriovoraceae bacterium]|nr:hypothetical protein [Halobacteriovoraceae bacterium]MCB9095663.1 hypothetical protein [Halobacteriovoraceae bacterium]
MKTSFLTVVLGTLFAHSVYLFFGEEGFDRFLTKQSFVDKTRFESFEGLIYFFSENKKPKLNFTSSDLVVLNANWAQFKNPKGYVFHSEKDEKMYFKAKEGEYIKEADQLMMNGEVRFQYKDAELDCDKGRYFISQEKFIGDGNVKSKALDIVTQDTIYVESKKITSFPMKKYSHFEEDVSGIIERKRKYEGKFYFWGEHLESRLLDSEIDLYDNVRVKRNNMDITADRSKIFLENFNKRFKYYELYDDVVVKQKIKERGTSNFYDRTAYAEKLTGHIREKKIILTGAPRVISRKDVIKGSKITLRENASLIEVNDSTSNIKYK